MTSRARLLPFPDPGFDTLSFRQVLERQDEVLSGTSPSSPA